SPPPTVVRRGVVRKAACARPLLFRGQELVHHDASVVVHDPPAHAAVVVFAVDAHASARVFHFAGDEVVVVILVVFAVRHPPAWCGLTLEAAVCVHASPSFRHFHGDSETPTPNEQARLLRVSSHGHG